MTLYCGSTSKKKYLEGPLCYGRRNADTKKRAETGDGITNDKFSPVLSLLFHFLFFCLSCAALAASNDLNRVHAAPVQARRKEPSDGVRYKE